MRASEQDRVANNKAWAEEAQNEKVAKWLADNPQIGVLNGPRYYVMEDGEIKYVEELS